MPKSGTLNSHDSFQSKAQRDGPMAVNCGVQSVCHFSTMRRRQLANSGFREQFSFCLTYMPLSIMTGKLLCPHNVVAFLKMGEGDFGENEHSAAWKVFYSPRGRDEEAVPCMCSNSAKRQDFKNLGVQLSKTKPATRQPPQSFIT